MNLDQIFQNSVTEIYVFDQVSLKFIAANLISLENLGYSAEEIAHLTPLDLKPSFTAETFSALVAPLRSQERKKVVFETLHRRKDGTTYPVEVHMQADTLAGTPVFVAIILDISARKIEQDALKDALARFKLVGEIAQLGSWEQNLRTGAVRWSATMCQLHRLPTALAPGTVVESRRFLHSADAERVVHPERVLEDSLAPRQTRCRVIRYDGVERILESTWEIFPGPDGRPERAVGVTLDVSEREATLAGLAVSNKRLAMALSASGLGAWTLDVAASTYETDETMSRMLGLEEQVMHDSQDSWLQRVEPSDAPLPLPSWKSASTARPSRYASMSVSGTTRAIGCMWRSCPRHCIGTRRVGRHT